MLIKFFKLLWNYLNKLTSETKSLLIIIIFGYIVYYQVSEVTRNQICSKFEIEALKNKEAEHYTFNTSIELHRLIQLILQYEPNASNAILLNYHNNTLSLLGYKYLYLSCLTEATQSYEIPILKPQWNRLDYIYYADELVKIHNQNYILITDLKSMEKSFPKLYRLVKTSDAKAVSFFSIEGRRTPVGLVVVFYTTEKIREYPKKIFPCILKLSLILDYEHR